VTSNVKVDVGLPTTVDVGLETGNIQEVVEIQSGGEVLQTQTAAVSSTISGRQITETPLTSRDALDLVTLLPGTAQVGRPRQSTINGLPKGALTITVDGVDVADSLLKSSDGFFTYVRPRLDAIEEVTVSSSASGADSSGDGAVQIKFITRRGTNKYRGGLFWQHRDHSLNSNYWWNNRNGLPRNPIILNQYGGNLGGYIPYLPRFGEGGPSVVSGRDKAFFFVNYEEFRIPESINRTRTILSPEAQNGVFRYGTSGQVNVLQLAANAGLTSTVDPTIGSLLSAIRTSTSQGTVTPITGDPNRQNFNFIARGGQVRKFLALRFDYNITRKHSLENVYNRQRFENGVDFLNNADPSFPGFETASAQNSMRLSNVTALRSTITNNIVNEARYGIFWGDSAFRPGLSIDRFQNQGGYNLNFNAPFGLTNVTAGAASAATGFSTAGISDNRRSSPTFSFSDNLTWIVGNHNLSFGGEYKLVKTRSSSINQLVPNVNFGVDSTDTSVLSLFTNTGANPTMPGATDAQVVQARNLYALLTGRVISIGASAYLTAGGRYEYLGDQLQSVKQRTYGLYAQDSWKMRPNLTLNFGLRWQPQEPFVTKTSNFSEVSTFAEVYGVSGEGNLFKPGTLTGKATTFTIVPAGFKPYKTDYNNFAPSVGVVYSPNFGESGLLATVFGKNNASVFRAGYGVSFVREGTNIPLSYAGFNGGALLDASRFVSQNTLPVGTLFRNISSVTRPDFPETPPATIQAGFFDQAAVLDPNLKTGTVHSWNVGYQRQLDKNMVIEARYVANRGRDLWRGYGINEINVTENGFVNEFKIAQANLAANNAAGGTRAGSFAYFGPGTGTQPLPSMQAYFRGVGDPTNAAQYTSALYRNATLITQLSTLAPNLIGFAGNVENNATRRANAIAAGLPANFFYVNPTVRGGGAFILDNSGYSQYDSLQIELRRRLSHGLQVQSSYTFAKAIASTYASSSVVFQNFRTLRNKELDKVLSPFDVRHAFKLSAIYELPFGRGQTFFSNTNRWVDMLIGGFSIIPVIKLQSGTPINFGNVNLVGMDRKELQKAVGVYYNQTVQYGTAAPVVASSSYLPADIIQNTHLAFNNQPFTGRAIVPATFGNCIQEYVGQCGFSNLIVHGPKFFRTDLSLSKRIKFTETRNIELRAALYNALNNPQWRVGGWAADSVTVTNFTATTFGQFTTGTVYQDTSTTNDQGGRTIELILRINF
jgi:hypothetical protein